jgi:hypothetical protein
LSPSQIDQNVFTESVNPKLETNRYQPRVLAIKQADDRFRRALLGRAMQSKLVRNKSNCLWMLLSENADVVVDESVFLSENVDVVVDESIQVRNEKASTYTKAYSY